MRKARLIKKAELAEQKPVAPPVSQVCPARQAHSRTRETLLQWTKVHQDARQQNPRTAFAALFTTAD